MHIMESVVWEMCCRRKRGLRLMQRCISGPWGNGSASGDDSIWTPADTQQNTTSQIHNKILQRKYSNTTKFTTSQIQGLGTYISGPLGNEFQDRPKYANKAEVQIINLKWSSMNHSLQYMVQWILSLRICWNVDIGSFCPSLMLVAMQNDELRGRFYSSTECSAIPNYELVRPMGCSHWSIS